MANVIQLPHRFEPRTYQSALFHDFFVKGYKRIVTVEHRRAGKDKCFLNLAVAATQMRVGTYVYMFPTATQARDVMWDGIDRNGMRYLDHIPDRLVAKTNNSKLSITFKNGSILKFGGTNYYDRVMGTNPIGYISSETQHHNPLAWEYVRPILAENGGWAIFNGTPRGHNHFYKLLTQNKNNPKWLTRVLTVEDTFRDAAKTIPVVTQEIIDEERASGMSEEIVQQEFYCSFEAALPGAYYAAQIKKAYDEQRVGVFKPEPKLKTYSSWDLGIDDFTSIWIIQVKGSEIRLVSYYENRRQPMDHYAKYMHDFKKKHKVHFDIHFAPHDIEVQELSSGLTRKQYAARCGINFRTVKKAYIIDGIEAVRALFQRFRIDAENCDYGMECLKEYHSQYDPTKKTYSAPVHNWASHGADALRYFALGWHGLKTVAGGVRKMKDWDPY